MEEFNRGWIATVLAANAELEIILRAATLLDADFNELTNTRCINRCERILWKDIEIFVLAKERSSVVAAHAETSLGQVVSSK